MNKILTVLIFLCGVFCVNVSAQSGRVKANRIADTDTRAASECSLFADRKYRLSETAKFTAAAADQQ